MVLVSVRKQIKSMRIDNRHLGSNGNIFFSWNNLALEQLPVSIHWGGWVPGTGWQSPLPLPHGLQLSQESSVLPVPQSTLSEKGGKIIIIDPKIYFEIRKSKEENVVCICM